MMTERDAVDEYFEAHPNHFLGMDENKKRILINTIKAECDLDKSLDSPCPRWVLNCLMSSHFGYKSRVSIIMRHHQHITGQKVNSYLTSEKFEKRINKTINHKRDKPHG